MKINLIFIWVAAVLTVTGVNEGYAQGVPQTLATVQVDMSTLATGYRVSKVVGGSVVNKANETVGTVDDLIVTPDEKVPFAVLSVGGFLGVGAKYVVVPFSAIQVTENKMVLPEATKKSLEDLPSYKYSK
ncbi:PRC-barrel domain-containing protein [Pararhodospirillum photometricum]|nr:PRC-barrel domain-containing protein [Pararhodospirillum photometricum]